MLHTLRYDAPASTWLEAIPLGNGHTGAMVHGRPWRELVQLNDSTAWSGSPLSEGSHGLVPRDVAASALSRSRRALFAGDHASALTEVKRLQGRYSQSYLPFADLNVTSSVTGHATLRGGDQANLTGYSRTLDLRTGEHVTRYLLDGREVRMSTIVSAPDGVLQMNITSQVPLTLRIDITTQLRVVRKSSAALRTSLEMLMPSDVAPPFEHDEGVSYSDVPGEAMHGVVVAGWTHNGEASDGPLLEAQGVTNCTIVLATETGFAGFGNPIDLDGTAATQRAQERVAGALARGADSVRARQRNDHQALYGRVALNLGGAGHPIHTGFTTELIGSPDHATELTCLLFHYGRYLLISSSRAGGAPANLQGLWNAELRPPWSSNYTLNINTEMNYWPAETANLRECLPPLFDLISALRKAGSGTAQRLYGARGWVAHHNSDLWAYTSPVGMGSADPAWAFWPLASAWLCLHVWEHIRFGADDGFARATAFPIIRSASEFYLDWLIELPGGTLGTAPSTSPENHFMTAGGVPSALGVSSTADLTLIRLLFDALDDLAVRLDLSADAVVQEARGIRDRLPVPGPGRDGLMREWAADDPQAEPQHRHLSHLIDIFPGNGDAGHRQAAIRSLEDRGDDSTGWSLAWKLVMRARLRQPGKVADLLRLFFRAAPASAEGQQGGLYPNLFAAHPPFQVDGNFGFVAGIAEVLLQSHGAAIELLPALPQDWPTGSVRGLVARPGIVVDLEWTGAGSGRPTLFSAHLRSLDAARGHEVAVAFGGRSCKVEILPGTAITLTHSDFA
ncbi:glycoside hydrolase N-terminal domain-containing protein [Arthrobacter sp.]|uniref:glycosyl hydrolase family 95 catalytic domain-containing protein n=1 Tax=Arthrobacter sp. TaxID=1667 RepID=UPI00258C6CD5|nr:glycoside hydrolase N-terminal domain-containing protein [Arthrobacter sp.]